MIYAILNSEGKCINRVVWDGDTSVWSPPEGCTAVCDDECCHPIENDRPTVVEESDPFESLTREQKLALIALLQESSEE